MSPALTDAEIATMAREAARCAWHHRHHRAGWPPCWKVVRTKEETGNADGPWTVSHYGPYGGDDRAEWCDNCRQREHHYREAIRWAPLARAAKGRLTRALDREAGRPGAGSEGVIL